jgi:1-acyl-sn-glycerol-3-phosphate acyltransferase
MASQKRANRELKMPKVTDKDRPFAMQLVARVLGLVMRLLFTVKLLKGKENVPKTGAYILAGNHVTYLDAIATAYLTFFKLKRGPHFMAKGPLFNVPVLGPMLRGVGQIPVYRNGRVNAEPMDAAKHFLQAGRVITIFPEGTLTRDPEGWPMKGRPGAVRLALETGTPVIPFGQWGTEAIMPTYEKKFLPQPWHACRFIIGKEIDLDKFRGRKLSNAELLEATDIVMQEILKLTAEVRGEKAPKQLYDPRAEGQSTTGNFKKESKR